MGYIFEAQNKLQSSSLRAPRTLERPRLGAWYFELPPGGHTRDGVCQTIVRKTHAWRRLSLLAGDQGKVRPPARSGALHSEPVDDHLAVGGGGDTGAGV